VRKTTVKVERCQVRHLHWHRLKCWEVLASLPLFMAWIAVIALTPKSVPFWIVLPAALVPYVAATALSGRGLRRSREERG
jgi:hypothetical protein